MLDADLHIHTTCSDGKMSPEQVVKKANKLNLLAISITDHDTVNGISHAINTAKGLEIEVIPGIEINTDYNHQEIHILGYYIDYNSNYLKNVLNDLQSKRKLRAAKIVRKLNDIDIDITFKEVKEKSTGQSIGRPHIAQVLIDRGYVKTIKDAFDLYIGRNKPAYVPRNKLSPFDAIKIVKRSKGIPVLAHPGHLKDHEIIIKLKKYGLAGLEVFHRDHNLEQIVHYKKIAIKNNLLITGGSDFHGNEPMQLGKYGIDKKLLLKLKKYKGLYIKH